MKISLENRVNMCPECMHEKRQCVCGSDRHPITMSRMMFELIQLQEDYGSPLCEVHCVDYIDMELIKSAGVA